MSMAIQRRNKPLVCKNNHKIGLLIDQVNDTSNDN